MFSVPFFVFNYEQNAAYLDSIHDALLDTKFVVPLNFSESPSSSSSSSSSPQEIPIFDLSLQSRVKNRLVMVAAKPHFLNPLVVEPFSSLLLPEAVEAAVVEEEIESELPGAFAEWVSKYNSHD